MKKHLKKLLIISMFIVLTITLVACVDNKNDPDDGKKPEVELGNYTVMFNSKSDIKYDNIVVPSGGRITKPTDPIKIGYDFNFWTLDPTSSDPKEFNFDTYTVTSNLTLTAHFDAQIYQHEIKLFEDSDSEKYKDKVSYAYPEDHEDEGDDITYLTSVFGTRSTEKLSLPTSTIENDYFVYWYYYSGETKFVWSTYADKEDTSVEEAIICNIDNPLTLYAMWHSNLPDIEITFDKNLGIITDGTLTWPADINSGIKINDTLSAEKYTNPSLPFHFFDGWYYKVEVKEKDEDGKTVMVEKEFDFILDAEDEENPTKFTHDITNSIKDNKNRSIVLFAKWVQQYNIYTANDFNQLTETLENGTQEEKESYANAYIKLLTNLNLGGDTISALFDSDMPFTGTFDGGNFTISNFKVKSTDNVSFIGISHGTIKNLKLSNIELIIDVLAEDKVSLVYAGGIVSKNYGTIENCHINGLVLSSELVYSKQLSMGGLAGTSLDGIIKDNTVTGMTISLNISSSHIGGLVGRDSNGDFEGNEVANLDVTLTSTASNPSVTYADIGVLIGSSYGTNGEKNMFTGENIINVSGESISKVQVGGFVGIATFSTFAESFGNVKINVVAPFARVGGLVGYSTSVLKDNHVDADITVSSTKALYVGGLIGSSNEDSSRSEIKRNYAVGNINVTGTLADTLIYAGGLIGNVTNLSFGNGFAAVNITVNANVELGFENTIDTIFIGRLFGYINEANTSIGTEYYVVNEVENKKVPMNTFTLNGEQHKSEGTGDDIKYNFPATLEGNQVAKIQLRSEDFVEKSLGLTKEVWQVSDEFPELIWSKKV